jgi:type I restriction enzyme S subunit
MMKSHLVTTELGPLPSDWRIASLHELVDEDRGIRYGIVQPGVFDPRGRLMIRGQDYSKGWVDADDMFRVGADVESRYRSARVRAGDLIITIVGAGTGSVEEVPPWLDGANLTQTTARIAVAPGAAHSGYVKAALQSAYGRAQVAGYIKGAAQPGLNCGDIEKFRLPLPPLPEQRAIAAALSDVDALISALDQLIAKKRDLKTATMQQLLTGQRRLPGFTGAWDIKRLGDVAHIKTGSRNNEDKSEDGEYPFFVRSDNVERIGSYSHDCEAILVPGEGRIGEIFHYINGRFDVHQRVYAITKFTPDVSGRFVYHYMRAHFGAWAMQNTVKATVDSLRLPTFQTFRLRIPATLKEQEAIAEVLGDIDAELSAIEARRNKTRHIKQGMMQELLTGRTRLA